MEKKAILSSIPKVDDLLNLKEVNELMDSIPRALIMESIREVLGDTRKFILESSDELLRDHKISIDKIAEEIKKKAAKKSKNHLKRVINATGVIIHTNLGRSVLSREAVKAVVDVAQNYSNLEYDLDEGKRGSRYSHVEETIVRITGAESAIAVNNNAAAVLLVLSTLCRNKEAIVSRGELVEIGGSFRVPEVMEQSGAKLIEVGSTNRTHLYDYERAINENTGVILKVHTSNYRILGFTESVSGRELVDLANKKGLPLFEDLGSGSFVDLSEYGVEYEPTVQEAVSAGIDVVTFSGDKMLGGPQAGIIVGKKKYIDMMKKNPLTRALRIDKMTIAALESTLRLYLDKEKVLKSIPALKMIVMSQDVLKDRARRLLRMIKNNLSGRGEFGIISEHSQIGGGSMPLENLPTFAVYIKPSNISISNLERELRNAETPVIVRTHRDSILFDVRTIAEDEYTIIRDTLVKIL